MCTRKTLTMATPDGEHEFEFRLAVDVHNEGQWVVYDDTDAHIYDNHYDTHPEDEAVEFLKGYVYENFGFRVEKI